jgi:lipopolysaccharide transport system permease protein
LRNYFDILTVLAVKDFKVRYRNSVLGFVWSLLNPLAYMAVLTLVFSYLLRVTIPNFAAWLLVGLLVWRFFQVGTSQGTSSIVGNPSLVSKVYVPRYLIVLSNNLANFIGSSLEFLVLLPLLVVLGVGLTVYALLLPPLLVLEFLLVFALSLSLSALNLKYRDFYQIWDIALQLGFWLSPIVYDAAVIPPRFSLFYSMNPMTSLIDAVRRIFLQQQLPTAFDMAVVLASIILLLALGMLIFRRLEKRFAEEL